MKDLAAQLLHSQTKKKQKNTGTGLMRGKRVNLKQTGDTLDALGDEDEWYEEQESWMKKHHCDQKCPKCNTWQGNCGGWQEVIRNDPTPMNDKTKCGKCGQWTTWFDFGMGFAVADAATGEPLQ